MTPDSGFFVLAHNIRSLHNVGSIFRTSDVFGVDKLYLSGYTGHPPDSRLEKVSLGAEKTVPWEYGKSAVRFIKKLRAQYPTLQVVGLENNLSNYSSISPVLSKTLSVSEAETSPPEGEKNKEWVIARIGTRVDAVSNSGVVSSGSSPKVGEVRRGMSSVFLHSFNPPFPLLLILGEEVNGISKPLQKLCDSFVEIPQYGQKESLNLSVAFGIAVYHIKNAIK